MTDARVAPPEHVASPDGTRIAFRRVGSGPRVLALHGGLGSWRSWLAVAERLADRFELVLIERRGRGASGAGTAPHALAREVEDARAVLDAVGPVAAVIGHSFGGTVALELARDDVAGLVLYEPGVYTAGLIPDAELDRVDELVERGEPKRALELGIELLHGAGLVSSEGATAPDALSHLAWTAAREIRAVASADAAHYASIRTPVLLLIGARSPARMQRNCDALAEALPNVRVAHLAGQGHIAHNADPDQVAAVVGSFLSQPARPSNASSRT